MGLPMLQLSLLCPSSAMLMAYGSCNGHHMRDAFTFMRHWSRAQVPHCHPVVSNVAPTCRATQNAGGFTQYSGGSICKRTCRPLMDTC